MSMTRQITREECARVGAAANESTTKRAKILFVGDINPAVLQTGSKITTTGTRDQMCALSSTTSPQPAPP